MSKKLDANRSYHCRYNLRYHLVLVTKYRNPAINDEVLETIKSCMEPIFENNKCEIIAINHDKDHIHVMFSAPPQVRLSTLVNNLKTVTSRMVRKHHSAWVSKFYWKPVFWNRSYYIGTVGDTTVEIVQQYIKNQGSRSSPIST